MFNLTTAYSLAYLILIVLVAAGYSYLLYSKSNNWSKWINYTLAALRFLLVFSIGVLLLIPSSKYISYFQEKPIVAFAVDNSKSLTSTMDSSRQKLWQDQMSNLSRELNSEGYEVKLETFTDEIDDWKNLAFNYPATDLNALIEKTEQQYQNQNLSQIVLVSDGIYNKGLIPTYNTFKVPIIGLGIGDTSRKVDLFLNTIYTNKVAYLNNQFPIAVEVINQGLVGEKTELKLLKDGEILGREIVAFTEDYQVQKVRFLAKAEAIGLQNYQIVLTPLAEEYITVNNTKNVFIDILDSKEHILILALTPHPDLRALRNIISQKTNYSVEIQTLNSGKPVNYDPNKTYDLAILHQIPNKRGQGTDLLKTLRTKKIPIWYIWGAQSDVRTYNKFNKSLRITSLKSYPEKVFPYVNPNFTSFQVEAAVSDFFQKCPPILTFYADYTVPNNTQVLLRQKVGNIELEKPLLVLNDFNNYKTATLLGEGLWQWWQHSSLIEPEPKSLNQVVSNLLQYLSVKSDKRKFKVYTSENRRTNLETVDFITETYNAIYERTLGKTINLTISNETTQFRRTYQYVNNTLEFKYRISNLEPGIYTFEAEAVLDGKVEKSRGKFSVEELQLESANQQANFNLLRKLAKQTQGTFFKADDLKNLKNWLVDHKSSNILHSQETNNPWIESYLLLALILGFAALEWGARKYLGQY